MAFVTAAQTAPEPLPDASLLTTINRYADNQVGTWPEFNKMIGGFFKFHWNDPQLITGITPTTFVPNDPITRGQVVRMLHREAGSPDGNPAHPFTDTQQQRDREAEARLTNASWFVIRFRHDDDWAAKEVRNCRPTC